MTNVRDLPFTKAVIDDIYIEDEVMRFKVVSKNYAGRRFRIRQPKNKAWVGSDAYTRNHPLAVKVVHYSGSGMNVNKKYARFEPDYEGE